MIIARSMAFLDTSLDHPRLELPSHIQTPAEEGVSNESPFRKCNLVVKNDYAKRLSILGFSIDGVISARGQSL